MTAANVTTSVPTSSAIAWAAAAASEQISQRECECIGRGSSLADARSQRALDSDRRRPRSRRRRHRSHQHHAVRRLERCQDAALLHERTGSAGIGNGSVAQEAQDSGRSDYRLVRTYVNTVARLENASSKGRRPCKARKHIAILCPSTPLFPSSALRCSGSA